ncbi:MAG: hypothetical protein ACE5JJ_11860 [Nitrospinota bacterium]
MGEGPYPGGTFFLRGRETVGYRERRTAEATVDSFITETLTDQGFLEEVVETAQDREKGSSHLERG